MVLIFEQLCWLMATGGVPAVNGRTRYVTARCLVVLFTSILQRLKMTQYPAQERRSMLFNL